MNNAIVKIEKLGFPWKTKDPFLFCVHHEDFYPVGNKSVAPDQTLLAGRNIGNDFTLKDGWRMYHGTTVPGFPCHPHRGFETVTINKKGYVDHSDSLGASGRFGPGDVQWMTAGKGIQHSEMFPLLNSNEPNTLEIFQVWLNLPKTSKFVNPYFKMLWNDEIPKVTIAGTNGSASIINVIAGNYNSYQAPAPSPDSWAATTENEVAILTIKMDANAELKLPANLKYLNTVLYYYKGNKLAINKTDVNVNHSIELDTAKEISLKNGDVESYLLLLQGRPIGEPVVQYGPFVMNTEAEIHEAYADFQKDQFGGWPWKSSDPVHGKEEGRFAKHADSTIELKDI